jgi:predicted N-acyltransferase
VKYEVQIAHGVEEVGQEAWDYLSDGRPFTSYQWYRFGERVMSYAEPVYIILSHAGEPVARATFWLTHRETIPIEWRAVRRMVEAMLRHWPLLICQAPLTSAASTSGLVLPDPPLRSAAIETIAQVALSQAQRRQASFCVFGYLEESDAQLGLWPPQFGRTLLWGSGTRMRIVWQDFEGYLAHLNKKRRYNVRRTLRLAADQGLEVKRYPKVEDVGAALRLHHNVNRRHNGRAEPWMRGAMEHCSMVDCAWLTVEQEGKLVGCELMLGDQDVWLVTGLGLEEGVRNAYFVLGYADIEHAIRTRARMLRWGSLTYEVKQRLGFELETNDWVVFGSKGALLQRVGQWVATREENQMVQTHAM